MPHPTLQMTGAATLTTSIPSSFPSSSSSPTAAGSSSNHLPAASHANDASDSHDSAARSGGVISPGSANAPALHLDQSPTEPQFPAPPPPVNRIGSFRHLERTNVSLDDQRFVLKPRAPKTPTSSQPAANSAQTPERSDSLQRPLNAAAQNLKRHSYTPSSASNSSKSNNNSHESATHDSEHEVHADPDSASIATEKAHDSNWAELLEEQRRKMHQTSSRLLRQTDDDRPFTRDLKDLFSTLVVSLPLTPHRVRFTKIEHTFTTDEALTNLGSLKFSQSNRMPDPKDPSRIVTTTTTTTFSMAREMARTVCNRFVEARFVESLDGKADFGSRSSVWQLTPKGMRVLTRFCQRNGIHQRHVNEMLDSPRNQLQMVILERDDQTDLLQHDRGTMEVIFRRFVGETGPNLKSTTTADSDSVHEYATGLVGVSMMRARKQIEKETPYVFTGKSAQDWLLDCCMVVNRKEAAELATQFLVQGFIVTVEQDRHTPGLRFQPTKNAHYGISEKGMRVAGWSRSPDGSMNGDAPAPAAKLPPGISRDSNNNKMSAIIHDPSLRLLFREFLQETHCEENLTFYLEVRMFLVDYGVAKRSIPAPRLDMIRETLASAYSLYNAFLAPGSPCELNIDHNLRNALAGRMTRAVGEDTEMIASLDEVAVLFDQAQTSVFKLMASDSVPKFSRDPKYAKILEARNYDQVLSSAFASSSIS
ncbi:hypothetical protein MBLNU459_g6070t1 [Dothideomycetes sp. NU459]